MQNFVCPRCAREGEGGYDDGDDEGPRLVINGGMLRKWNRSATWDMC